MVITVLEGKVPVDKTTLLIEKYREIVSQKPPSIKKTYLANDAAMPMVWRIITVWRSQEDLESMRKQGTPAGVLVFRVAGSEPVLSVYQVKEQSTE